MKVNVKTYRRIAKFVGALLTLMGVGLGAVFVQFMWMGTNPFTQGPLILDGPGLLILASIGAFALPIGISLFSSDPSTSARLRIAGGALGFMALLRLAAYASPSMRAVVGVAPLIEFFVLGSIGLVAYSVRPENESPIETHMEVELDAPASAAWQILGEEFGDVGKWATGLLATSVDREVGVGAVRTCDIEGLGPFPAGRITEELLEFDPGNMRFTYAATSGMPAMFERAQNRWSIESVGPDRCRVRSHASIDVHWWALPFARWAGWSIQSGVRRFGEELRYRVEQGRAHPRKLATLTTP